MLLELYRISNTPSATYGVLLYEQIPFTNTLERPWLNNQKGHSCIPGGEYICKRVHSAKFGNTFEVTNVPGRSSILFHKGNIADDSHGCILLGDRFAYVGGFPGVADSALGFAEFLQLLEEVNSFNLTIFTVTK